MPFQLSSPPVFDKYSFKEMVRRRFSTIGGGYGPEAGLFSDRQLEVMVAIITEAMESYSRSMHYFVSQNTLSPEDVHKLFLDGLLKDPK